MDISYRSILELATKEGINASGREEIFGCIFGRDSAITILKLIKVIENPKRVAAVDRLALVDICRRALVTLANLQGKQINIASGEEPGKFIHEFRRERFDHLTGWYIYPDGLMRNYDSIDATPLGLVAVYKYWRMTNDVEFIEKTLPAVEKGLRWILDYGDADRDGLLEYEFKPGRSGGLRVQSWTDSVQSLARKDGSFPEYPIAPVEVQAYAWWALTLWSEFYGQLWPELRLAAAKTRSAFCRNFVIEDERGIYLAQALDGQKNQISTVTGNPLLVLWASREYGSGYEAIINKELLDKVVKRAFQADLFDPVAGVRTMSTLAPTFNGGQDSYHNGSFWPKLNGLAHEGLAMWGYAEQARRLREASLAPLTYFQTPIELYVKGGDGTYLEYKNSSGQVSCKTQAWSAAVALDLLTA